MITLNTIVKRFEDFADNHFFIRSFSFGGPEDVDLEKFDQYPLLHLIYTGATYEDTTKTLDFEVYIFDLPSAYEDKNERQKEVVSDAEQCAEDILADIANGQNIFIDSEDYEIANASVTPLQEANSNVLAGVLLELSITLPYDRSACDAPINGVQPEGGGFVYQRRGLLRVLTQNGTVDVLSVNTIKVTNGTLIDEGNGVVSIDTGGGGGGVVASVTGTAPIVSSGGTNPAISITAATTSAAGSMSASDKTKLDGIAAGAEVNVQSDWNAVSGDALILNKPTLATVATSGAYSDLTGIPSLVASVGATAPITSTGGTTPTIAINAATTSATGSMSAADKTKLDGITAGAAVASVTGTAPIVSSGGTSPAISITAATTSAAGSMSSADKTKLDGIAAGAEVNQNAFSNVAVSGQTTVSADTKTDTLTLVAGTNITLTTDAGTDSITIAASGGGGGGGHSFGTIAVATQSNVVADSGNDTLTFAIAGGMAITTNATTDTITFDSKYLDFDDVTLQGARLIEMNGETLRLQDSGQLHAVAEFTTDSVDLREVTIRAMDNGSAGYISLMEAVNNGTNGIRLQAPTNLAANTTYTLPSADGTSGQVLATNGSGGLSWATASGGGASYSTVRTQSGTTYTLALTDAGDYIQTTSTTAVTITVPLQSSVTWAADTEIYFEQNNTGQITIAGASGVTVNSSETLKTAGRYSVIALKRVASDTWTLTGERQLA